MMADHPFTGTLSVTDKIGIGISDPLTQLHILSSTAAPSQAFLESGGALLKLSVDASGASIGTDNAFPLSIQTDGSPRISINSTGDIITTGALAVQNNLLIVGNVGIGTTTAPTAKLEVNGTVKANSLQIGALTVQSVSSGTPATNTLQVNGAVKATSFQGNGATLDGIVKKAGDTIIGLLTVQNNLAVTGNIGIGIPVAVAPLHIAGGNWNPNDSEGDFRLGDATYKFKIGIARGGGGAGDVRLRAQGGTNRMMLGGGTNDALFIQNNEVSIPSGQLSFGAQTRQMINLWQQVYGIGVQGYTHYFRTDENFAWFKKGSHSDTTYNPGSGGSRLMALNGAGDLILSARTNPEADPAKSPCRALVDLNKTLAINFANDYSDGVYIDGTVRFGGAIGGFTGNNADEWPNIVWYRDIAANWDEGLIKHASNKGFFGRTGFGIHIHASRDWGIWSTNWTPLLGVEGGSGNVVARGSIRQASSRELKENIDNLAVEEAVETLKGMNPVKFNYKADSRKETHLGFVAEDVPDLVASYDRKALSSMDIVTVLTKVVQAQQTTISILTEKVKFLEEQSQLWQASRD
ncbi:MAG TPA: tail fiber domain-containing protein [Allocoleopsis sp.]